MPSVVAVRTAGFELRGFMNLYQKYKNLPKEKRGVVNVTLTFSCGMAWSVIKLLLGIYQNSGFLMASAFFTMSLSVSKMFCLVGIIKHQKRYVRWTHVLSSLFIVLGGVFYGMYNLRLVNGHTAANYGLIPSIAIATVSFTLFVKAVVVLFRDKKQDDYHRNLRILSLIGGCVDLVLTQMSLLAVESPEMDPSYNFYIAFGVAILTVGLGIYCLVAPFSDKKLQRTENDDNSNI